MDNEQMTIEEAFTALESLLGEMENPEISLEESFAKYKKGLDLVNYCSKSIDHVEEQLSILEAE